jgi:hypothetical protein
MGPSLTNNVAQLKPRSRRLRLCREPCRQRTLSRGSGCAFAVRFGRLVRRLSQERIVKAIGLASSIAITIAIGSLPACGAQATPQRPSGSAASLSEPEAARAPVARALREDPPLPGTAAEGWEGLQQPAGAAGSDPHEHHQHHHHHQHGKAQP